MYTENRKDEDWGYNCSTSCGGGAHFVTGCKTRAKLILIFSPIDLRIDSFALHLSLSSYLDNQEKQKGYSYDYKTKFKKE